MHLPETTERVESHTNHLVKDRIEEQTERNIAEWKVRSDVEVKSMYCRAGPGMGYGALTRS